MMAYITAAFSGFDGNFFSSSPMPFIALKISTARSLLQLRQYLHHVEVRELLELAEAIVHFVARQVQQSIDAEIFDRK
jgi:hypothetical protein